MDNEKSIEEIRNSIVNREEQDEEANIPPINRKRKDRKELCNDMKPIYQAVNKKNALENLEKFENKWVKK